MSAPANMEFRRPICPHGHDKRVVGVTPGRFCRICARERARLHKEREQRAKGVPPDNFAYLPGLRYHRTHAGITQKRLGEMVGMDPHSICALENQKRPTRLSVRKKLAAAIGCTPGDLMVHPPGKPKELRTNHMPAAIAKRKRNEE